MYFINITRCNPPKRCHRVPIMFWPSRTRRCSKSHWCRASFPRMVMKDPTAVREAEFTVRSIKFLGGSELFLLEGNVRWWVFGRIFPEPFSKVSLGTLRLTRDWVAGWGKKGKIKHQYIPKLSGSVKFIHDGIGSFISHNFRDEKRTFKLLQTTQSLKANFKIQSGWTKSPHSTNREFPKIMVPPYHPF